MAIYKLNRSMIEQVSTIWIPDLSGIWMPTVLWLLSIVKGGTLMIFSIFELFVKFTTATWQDLIYFFCLDMCCLTLLFIVMYTFNEQSNKEGS